MELVQRGAFAGLVVILGGFLACAYSGHGVVLEKHAVFYVGRKEVGKRYQDEGHDGNHVG